MTSISMFKEKTSKKESASQVAGDHGNPEDHALKRRLWTEEEDSILIDYVMRYGEEKWNAVQTYISLLRNGNSCRQRWTNYLYPALKKGSISPQETSSIMARPAQLGNDWAHIASYLPGRTKDEVKNNWNDTARKLKRAGIPVDPDEFFRNPRYDLSHGIGPSIGQSFLGYQPLQSELCQISLPEDNPYNSIDLGPSVHPMALGIGTSSFVNPSYDQNVPTNQPLQPYSGRAKSPMEGSLNVLDLNPSLQEVAMGTGDVALFGCTEGQEFMGQPLQSYYTPIETPMQTELSSFNLGDQPIERGICTSTPLDPTIAQEFFDHQYLQPHLGQVWSPVQGQFNSYDIESFSQPVATESTNPPFLVSTSDQRFLGDNLHQPYTALSHSPLEVAYNSSNLSVSPTQTTVVKVTTRDRRPTRGGNFLVEMPIQSDEQVFQEYRGTQNSFSTSIPPFQQKMMGTNPLAIHGPNSDGHYQLEAPISKNNSGMLEDIVEEAKAMRSTENTKKRVTVTRGLKGKDLFDDSDCEELEREFSCFEQTVPSFNWWEESGSSRSSTVGQSSTMESTNLPTNASQSPLILIPNPSDDSDYEELEREFSCFEQNVPSIN